LIREATEALYWTFLTFTLRDLRGGIGQRRPALVSSESSASRPDRRETDVCGVPSTTRATGPKWRQARLRKVLNDDRADWQQAYALFPGDVAYVWREWDSNSQSRKGCAREQCSLST